MSAFRGRSATWVMHRYSKTHISSDAAKRWRVAYWLNGKGKPGGAFDSYFDFNAACLTETVKLARAKGYEVLLMECPRNAVIAKDAFERYKAKYSPLCQQLVDEQGAHYVDLNESAGLLNIDFRDLYHLVEPGRAKWQPKLADALAEVFVDHMPPEPTPLPSTSPSLTQSSPEPAGVGGSGGE